MDSATLMMGLQLLQQLATTIGSLSDKMQQPGGLTLADLEIVKAEYQTAHDELAAAIAKAKSEGR